MLAGSLYKSLLTVGTLLSVLTVAVSGLGTSCSAPITRGTAGPNDPFWQQNIQRLGTAAFNSNPNEYKVFRNVKEFGAKGDGNTDDTAAINNAITSGGRCGQGCDSTTTQPAIIYFPPGTYKVSSPIVSLYQTHIIGDARNLPTLLAAPNFAGIAVIDGNPFYINQNNFLRSVRNFIIDVRQVNGGATGLHWQVSQATSLTNVVFEMSTAPGNQHQGIFMENGSGGMMGDLVFNGGKLGAFFGNQQFTVRNVTFNNPQTGGSISISAIWNWGWTFQGITINNAQVGFDITVSANTVDQGVGGEAIIDGVINNTPTFIQFSRPSNGNLPTSLVLNNIRLNGVQKAVAVANGATLLNGGTFTIDSWAQGNVYSGTNGDRRWTQGNIASIQKASPLLDNSGKIFGRTQPQYADFAVDQFISVKAQGAKGDGRTDDTQAIKNVFAKYAGCKVIFFDAGVYIVTSTITIPAGTQIVGEAWSVIQGSGNAFTNYNNPQVVVRVGDPGSTGLVEISDMIFSTKGPAAGAIVVEWNIRDPAGQQGVAGAWNSHIVLGGYSGSNLLNAQCAKLTDSGNACFAAFLALHLTSQSSAYIEGLWAWLADHDLDSGGGLQISLYSGRGIYSESQGPVWLVGTGSEHHVQYQYYLNGARNHYIGLAQTESPYFQPAPVPPAPFITNTQFKDPSPGPGTAWAMDIVNSQNILVFGAGFYNFFQNYGQDCIDSKTCGQAVLNIDSGSTVGIYSLATVATKSQLNINGQSVIDRGANANGFADTVTVWTR